MSEKPNILFFLPDQHRGDWHQPSVHIPLLAAGPGIRCGIRSNALVSLHDLAATFIDYAQAEVLPEMEPDLVQILTAELQRQQPGFFSDFR